jgi:hypothetical protein
MNTKASLFFLAVLAAFIVLIGWVQQRATALDKESAGLTSKIQALEKALAQATAARNDQSASSLTQSDKLELMRLRNEVTQLRSSNAALAKIESENARLRTELLSARAADPNNGAPPGSIARDQWSFRGYATPDAAYVSALWAMKEGRVDTLLSSLTPEQRQQFETDNQTNSQQEITDRLKKEVASMSAVHITSREQVSPGEVVLGIQVHTHPNVRLRNQVRMHLVNNEWKAADLIDQPSYDPLAFYRKNPELMRRYFPHLFKEQQAEQPTASE